jgi:hypothetical protein
MDGKEGEEPARFVGRSVEEFDEREVFILIVLVLCALFSRVAGRL